jgi:protein TonB
MKIKYLLFFLFFSVSVLSAQNLNSNSVPLEYDNVDLQPGFPGGLKEFFKFVGKNYVTPEVEGLSGVFNISFIIEANGNVGNVKIIGDLGSGTKEEAIRVMALCPRWFPGEHNGTKVRVIYQFPFTINN